MDDNPIGTRFEHIVRAKDLFRAMAQANLHGSTTDERPKTHERRKVMMEKTKGLDRRHFMKMASLAVYRPAGGYARIAALVKQIRVAHKGHVLFCDCADTLHGTYPVLKTQGQSLMPVLNFLSLDAMTAHREFAYGPAVFKQRAAGDVCLSGHTYNRQHHTERSVEALISDRAARGLQSTSTKNIY